MESYADFLLACQQLASSVGEFASLAVLAVCSYLLVAVRSLAAKLQASLTKSPSVFAPVRRKRGPRSSPLSSALPGASAANLLPRPQESNNDGVSQQEGSTPVDRFLSSVSPQELQAVGLGSLRPGADGPDSAGRPAAAERTPDRDGANDSGSGAASSGVLGPKTG